MDESIKPHIPGILNTEQTGYITNRYISKNVRLIADVISYTNPQYNPGLILQVQFERAFDTIAWHFIQKPLSAFNFRDTF